MRSSGDGLVKSNGLIVTDAFEAITDRWNFVKTVLDGKLLATITRPNGDAWRQTSAKSSGLESEVMGKFGKISETFSDCVLFRPSTTEHLLRRADAKFKLTSVSEIPGRTFGTWPGKNRKRGTYPPLKFWGCKFTRANSDKDGRTTLDPTLFERFGLPKLILAKSANFGLAASGLVTEMLLATGFGLKDDTIRLGVDRSAAGLFFDKWSVASWLKLILSVLMLGVISYLSEQHSKENRCSVITNM